MLKSFYAFAVASALTLSSSIFANICCPEFCQSLEFGCGWREDSIKWKTTHYLESGIPAEVNDNVRYKKVPFYVVYGKAVWFGREFYIRLNGQYGLSYKGRNYEHFSLKSPLLFDPVSVHTSHKVLRRSEVYDGDAAVGYPIFVQCGRGYVVPTIGFSFHRQRLRDRSDKESSCTCSSSCESSCCSSCSSSSDFSSSSSSSDSFSVDSSSNDFIIPLSSDPFSSPSDPEIASALGLSTRERTNMYRFTWYGPYAGFDTAYALDPCWTIYGKFEGHFLNNCHRKRHGCTGVFFVDKHHQKGWAYGFDGTVGTVYSLDTCWYFTFQADYTWWKAHSKKDHRTELVTWQNVDIMAGIGIHF